MTLTSTSAFEDAEIARQLLRTGVFNVSPSSSPLDALRKALATVSPDTQGTLWLTATEAEQEEPALLSVRCRKSSVYSLHTSLKRYDRIRPGILGGLLNNLRCAARATAPMFTPYDAIVDAFVCAPFDPREDTFDEAADLLRRREYKSLSEPEKDRRMKALSNRDAAKVMAMEGHRTYLDDHKFGWTLGKDMLSSQELADEIDGLPADLYAGVECLNRCVKELEFLTTRMPADLDDPRFENFGGVDVAFFVTGGHPDRLAKDALSEYFDEIVHQRAHILDEEDSWPLWSIPIQSQKDYRRVSQALIRTARAQQLVHTGLMVLGAQKC
ncbi:hypothetical protein Q0M94_25245 (plasmid) [Deinococcus radiomollis]|uniref:hypothetical protein n=1 Tax=Deinococcus radiomollis TaxID=468916 RepID=UPI003892BA71